MSFFRRSGGGSTKLVELGADISVSSFDGTSPYLASSSYKIDANAGTYTTTRVGNVNDTNTVKWALRGDYSLFYVRATVVANSTPSGTLTGSWFQTNADRTWTISSSTTDRSVLLIEISNKSDGSLVVDSHQVTLEATTSNPI